MPLALASISLDSLTSFDWFLVIVASISTLLAFRRGFIRVLFSLAGWVAGTLLASWNYMRGAAWLEHWITNPLAAEAIAFLAILLAVSITFGMAAGLVRRTAKAVGLGFVDRLLGAALGLLRGVLVAVAAIMALTAFDPHSGWLRGSLLAPYFLTGAHAVSFVVPQHLQRQIAEGTRHLSEKKPVILKHYPSQQ